MARVHPIVKQIEDRIVRKKAELAEIELRAVGLGLGIAEDEQLLIDAKPKERRKRKKTPEKPPKVDTAPAGPTIQCKACTTVSEVAKLKTKTKGAETWYFCPKCDAEIVIDIV